MLIYNRPLLLRGSLTHSAELPYTKVQDVVTNSCHKFYLAVADDLVYRARVATAQGLRQKLVHFGAHPISGHEQERASSHNYLP